MATFVVDDEGCSAWRTGNRVRRVRHRPDGAVRRGDDFRDGRRRRARRRRRSPRSPLPVTPTTSTPPRTRTRAGLAEDEVQDAPPPSTSTPTSTPLAVTLAELAPA